MADLKRRAFALATAWMSLLGVGMILALTERFPLHLALLRPEFVNVFLVELEVLFVLFLWPIVMPWLLEGVDAPAARARRLLALGAMMLLLDAPLVAIAHHVAEGSWASLLTGRLLTAAAIVFVAGTYAGGPRDAVYAARWYFPAVFALAAGLPYAHYLFVEYLQSPALAAVDVLSPFWTASQLGDGARVTALIFASAGLLIGFVGGRLRRAA